MRQTLVCAVQGNLERGNVWHCALVRIVKNPVPKSGTGSVGSRFGLFRFYRLYAVKPCNASITSPGSASAYASES